MKEQVKPIIIHDHENGKEYTLEFSRETVKKAEQDGFRIKKAEDPTLDFFEDLFYYSFLMHHPYVSRKLAMELAERLGGISKLIGRLSELYVAPYNTLINSEETEGDEKNAGVSVEL